MLKTWFICSFYLNEMYAQNGWRTEDYTQGALLGGGLVMDTNCNGEMAI